MNDTELLNWIEKNDAQVSTKRNYRHGTDKDVRWECWRFLGDATTYESGPDIRSAILKMIKKSSQ